MFKLVGGDVAGMSTVPEVMVCAQCGINVLGISIIGNKGLNLVKEGPEHNDVLKNVENALGRLSAVLLELIPELA